MPRSFTSTASRADSRQEVTVLAGNPFGKDDELEWAMKAALAGIQLMCFVLAIFILILVVHAPPCAN
jgi:hypothetical protein